MCGKKIKDILDPAKIFHKDKKPKSAPATSAVDQTNLLNAQNEASQLALQRQSIASLTDPTSGYSGVDDGTQLYAKRPTLGAISGSNGS